MRRRIFDRLIESLVRNNSVIYQDLPTQVCIRVFSGNEYGVTSSTCNSLIYKFLAGHGRLPPPLSRCQASKNLTKEELFLTLCLRSGPIRRKHEL